MEELKYWELYLVNHGLSILFSGLIALASFWIARFLRRKLIHFFEGGRNQAIKLFFVNLIYGAVLVVAAIIVLGKLGVPTASLITILGTSSLAIGLAMKDFLANIAAGAIIVFQKPFDIGDLVDVKGTLGTVDHIDLFSIRLRTPNHEAVTIPNGLLVKEKIVKKAYQGKRRIELVVGISYESSIKEAKRLVLELADRDPRVLSDPKPVVAVNELAESAVNLTVRVWVQSTDYIHVRFDLLEQIKETFDASGIKIPYPQREIWIRRAVKEIEEV